MKSTYGTMYYVNDMKQSVAFYKTLGGAPTYESDSWTEFDMSGHRLCLHSKTPGQTHPENGILIMNHDGVNSLFEKMKGDGFNVFGLHVIHPGASSFHFKDNSSNELSFYGKP